MDATTKALMDPVTGHFKRGSVIFYHSGDCIGTAIDLGEGGAFDHVAVALGTGQAICAELLAGGVTAHFADFQQESIEARLYPGDIEAFIGTLAKQIGKPYDFPMGWLAALLWRIGIKIGGGPPDRFDCSSLIAYCWDRRKDWGKPVRDVTPQDIWAAMNP